MVIVSEPWVLTAIILQVERDRNTLIVQTLKQLNTQFHRRSNAAGPALAVHRVKVTFRDEPGEGSGVARSFYTAFAQAVLSQDKLPSLEGVLVGSKHLQQSKLLPYPIQWHPVPASYFF